MDDEMAVDIDDLFGDGTGLIPEPRSSNKEMFERVADLESSGCRQSIAWSRQGFIASITPNGAGLELQNLRINPRDGSWGLSDPTPPLHLANSANGGGVQLQHLHWSPNGSDLAVIDSAGRLAILAFLGSLDKPSLTRDSQMDPVDELHAVVGSYWIPLLPQTAQQVVVNMAVKTSSEGYRYEKTHSDNYGPSVPYASTASALLCVTANGILRLLWTLDRHLWREVTTEIDSIITFPDDLITHASICADKDKLLLAYATTSQQLRILRIEINWPKLSQEERVPKTSPIINVTHLAATNWMDAGTESESSPLLSPELALCHLRIVSPSNSEQSLGMLRYPTILTVRSRLPQRNQLQDQDMHSAVERWELVDSTPEIHPAFANLSARRDSVSSKNVTSPKVSSIKPARPTLLTEKAVHFLNKMTGLYIKKIITWIDSIQLDRILVVGYIDGSVEYRDRTTLEDISSKGGLDKFYSLTQVGFGYNAPEPSVSGSLSPSGLSVAHKMSDGTIRWKGLVYLSDDMGSPGADVHYTSFIAGLTMAVCTLVLAKSSNDDVLAIACQFKGLQGRELAFDLVSEISRNLDFKLDYSEDVHHESLLSDSRIQLSMSIMSSLGYNGEASHRDFSATISWLSLQLRNSVLTLLTLTGMKKAGSKDVGLYDPDAIRVFAGTVRWSLDLMSWIIDCLIHPNDPAEFDETFNHITKAEPLDLGALNNYLYSTHNVALHLLLGSATRGFLSTMCRRLTHLDYTARTEIASAMAGEKSSKNPMTMTNALRASYTSIVTLTSNSAVPLHLFDRLVMKIAENAKAGYIHAGLPVSEESSMTKNRLEQQILLGRELPQSSAYVISKIFREDLPLLKAEIDPAVLFFHDFSLLNLPLQDRGTRLPYFDGKDPVEQRKMREKYLNYRLRHTVDVFQRKPIEFGKEPEEGQKNRQMRRWRRCVRCASVMEDLPSISPHTQLFIFFLLRQHTRCNCTGHWDIMTGKRCIP